MPLLSAVEAKISIVRKKEEQNKEKAYKEDNKISNSEIPAENLNQKKYSAGDEIIGNSELNEMLERMTKVYKDFRIFEEITRNFLCSTLKDKIGANWWNNGIDKKVIDKVTARKKQDDKNKWHSVRGHGLISFVDFDDLCKIVISPKSWHCFKDIFPNEDWIKSIFLQLNPSRNTVMHSEELDKRDIDRITILMSDWYKQIGHEKEQKGE